MKNFTELPQSFFERSSVVVARELLGKYLMRRIDGKTIAYRIVETESYEGTLDQASHAYRGQTPRNTPMFGEAGTIYVYFTYGMHYMLNIVCGKVGYPSAVLVRGVEDCIGPGRLTKKLAIDKSLNTKKLGKKSGLWVAEKVGEKKVKYIRTPRVGVAYAGEKWASKLYRFVEKSK